MTPLLQSKIEYSINLIKKAEPLALQYSDNGFRLAFSGGKDSQVLYELAKSSLSHADLVTKFGSSPASRSESFIIRSILFSIFMSRIDILLSITINCTNSNNTIVAGWKINSANTIISRTCYQYTTFAFLPRVAAVSRALFISFEYWQPKDILITSAFAVSHAHLIALTILVVVVGAVENPPTVSVSNTLITQIKINHSSDQKNNS